MNVKIGMTEEIENQYKLINTLRDKYPTLFLTSEFVRINNELYPIGIFMCSKCKKPILHPQFNWSGLCATCDLGNDSPKWEIKKPLKYQVVDRLS